MYNYPEGIVNKYIDKGLDLDGFYTPLSLAKLKIITTTRGLPACEQFIRRACKKDELMSITQGQDFYLTRKIRGEWVLDYLNSKGEL